MLPTHTRPIGATVTEVEEHVTGIAFGTQHGNHNDDMEECQKCSVTKIPSVYGRCLAPTTLKHATPMTDMRTETVACRLVGVHVSVWFMTIKPWMIRLIS